MVSKKAIRASDLPTFCNLLYEECCEVHGINTGGWGRSNCDTVRCKWPDKTAYESAKSNMLRTASKIAEEFICDGTSITAYDLKWLRALKPEIVPVCKRDNVSNDNLNIQIKVVGYTKEVVNLRNKMDEAWKRFQNDLLLIEEWKSKALREIATGQEIISSPPTFKKVK